MAEHRLRVGVAGLGRAFLLMMPTLVRHPNVQLVAAADPRAEARARFEAVLRSRLPRKSRFAQKRRTRP